MSWLFLLGYTAFMSNNVILSSLLYCRPHDYGLYSLEACDLNQFDMFLRIAMGLPCYEPSFRTPWAFTAMMDFQITNGEFEKDYPQYLSVPGLSTHCFNQPSLGNILSTICVTADNLPQLNDRLELIGLSSADIGFRNYSHDRIGIILEDEKELLEFEYLLDMLEKFGLSCEVIFVPNSLLPTKLTSINQITMSFEVVVTKNALSPLSVLLEEAISIPLLSLHSNENSIGGKSLSTKKEHTKLLSRIIRVLSLRDQSLKRTYHEAKLAEERLALEEGMKLEDCGWRQYIRSLKERPSNDNDM